MEKAVADFIASEMQDWASEFITARKRQLTRSKVISTGALVNSLDFEVDKQAKQDCIACLLAFEEHGRWVDMKIPRRDDFGTPYIQALQDWIVRRGWESKMIEQYVKNRKLRKVPVNVLNNIAWSIATSKIGTMERRRNWYQKPKAKAIEGLFDALIIGLPQAAAGVVANALAAQPVENQTDTDTVGIQIKDILTGARGGRYFIDSNGRKVYVRKT
jgi:hypothetical protein